MNKPQKTKTLRALQAGLLASSLFAAPAFGARLAYEGFDYTQADGTTITGLNGGTGWDEAFPAPTGGSMTVQPGLTYSGLTTVGKAMRWTPGSTTGQGRDWGGLNPTTPPADGTYWFSVVVNANGVSQGNFNWMFSTGANAFGGQNGVGVRTSNSSGALSFRPVNPANDAGGNPVAGTGTVGTPTFIVGRLTLTVGSDSNFRIWVNPSTDPSVIPGDGDANSSQTTISAADTSTLRASISGRAFGSNPGYIEFDEIRIGNSFSEILPRVGNFTVSPSSGVENQTLTFDWSAIPSSATSITLNPGNIDLLTTLTTNGAGTTTLPAPAASTNYTLTFSDGVSTEVIDAPYTAIAPFLTISPASGYLGDTLTLNWRIPAGATGVTLSPNPESVSLDFDSATGIGTAQIAAPAFTTLYTITWTGAGDGATGVSSTFTLLDSVVSVTPDKAIAQVSDLTIQWRIDPAFSVDPVSTSVFLDVGPIGGPYVTTDVTTNTVSATGAGTVGRTPLLTDLEYRIRFHLNSVEQTLTDTVTLYPKVFNLGTPVNNTKPVQTNLQPMFDGVTAYSDRGHVWSAVPTILQGAQFVKMGQDDKFTSNLQIPFTATAAGTFFLLIDNRIGDNVGGSTPATGTDSPPLLPNSADSMAWVTSSGFVDSGVDVGLDESPSGATSIDQSYSVYFRQVNQGDSFTFYEQNDTTTGGPGGRNMYGIAAVSPQVVPVAFVANPPAFTLGAGGTTLQWTVPPLSAVSINPSVGTLSTDPVTGVGSIPIDPAVTTDYTLTFDPPGAATLPVNLTIKVNVNTFTVTPDTIDEGQSTTLNWQVPAGATAVTISNGVGVVTLDTNANGAGSRIITPLVNSTYILSYTAAGATTATTVGSVFVTVNPDLSFAGWIDNNFGGNTVPLGLRGPNDDPDNDGLSNLMEYAIDSGDPTRSTGSPATFGEGNLVTFFKNQSAIGLTYVLEKSGTLANDWVPATPLTSEDASEISYTLAPPTPSKEFIRLKVTQD